MCQDLKEIKMMTVTTGGKNKFQFVERHQAYFKYEIYFRILIKPVYFKL